MPLFSPDVSPRMAVALNDGVTVGTRRQLDVIEGTGISLTLVDDGAHDRVQLTITGPGMTIQNVTSAGTTVLTAPATGDLLVKVDHSGVTLDLPLSSTMVGRRVYVVADQPSYAATVHTSSGSLDALVQFGAQTAGGGTSFTQVEDAGGTGAVSQVYLADDSGNWFVLQTAPTALPAAVAYTDVANTFLENQYVIGDVVVTGAISATASVTGQDVVASGLTGATGASRYVGATASGAPVAGTFAVGDFIIARSGALWVCTTAGSPGTWTQVGALPADVAYTDVANDFTTTQSIDVGGSDEALDMTSFSGTTLTATSVAGRAVLANSTSGDAGYFSTGSGHGIVGASTTGVGIYAGSEQNTALHAEHQGSLIAATALPTFSVLRAGVTASTNVYSGPLIFGNDAPTGSAASTGPLLQLQHNTSDAFVVDNLGKLTFVSGSMPSNGQLLIGDGTGFSVASLTAGSGVTITPGAGTISIAATGGAVALPQVLAYDSFRRVNQAGWGPLADGIYTWSVFSLGGSDDTITTKTGLQTGNAGIGGGINVMIATPALSVDDLDVVLRWTVSNAGDGLKIFVRDNGLTFSVWAKLQLTLGGPDASLGINGDSDSDFHLVTGGGGPVLSGATGGQIVWTRLRLVGLTYSWRSWADGDTEPNVWDATYTTTVACSGRNVGLQGGLTDVGHTLSVTHFVVEDLG